MVKKIIGVISVLVGFLFWFVKVKIIVGDVVMMDWIYDEGGLMGGVVCDWRVGWNMRRKGK